METINLSVKSPKVALPGLDDLITRMERADALIDKLGKAQTIRIKFAISGEEHLQVAATNLESLAQAFKAVGETKIGDGLARGLMTPGEAARESAREVEKLKLRFKELNETAVASTAKFQSQSAYSSGDLANLSARRKAIEGIIGERNAVQARMQGLERAGGMAEAMSGGVAQVTAAERALAPASDAAAGALEAQDAVVRRKMAAMQGLAGAVERTTAAETAQTTAATEAAAANAAGAQSAVSAQQSALLNERVIRDQEGEEVNRIRRMRTGAGQTTTISNAGTVEALDTVGAHRAAFEAMDAEFAGRKANLAQGGFGAGSAEQIELLRQEVAVRRTRVQAMQQEGLGAESLAQKQRLLAAGLEKTANVAEQDHMRTAVTDAQASSQRNLTNGLREQIAILDRQYHATRGLAQSELELADAARRRAAEYRTTANDVRSAEKMGGLAPDATRESYLRAMETKAARLEADAQKVEQRMMATRQANAAASRQFEQEFADFGGQRKRTVEEKEAGGGRVVRTTAARKNASGDEETLNWTRRFGSANEELESKLTRTTNAVQAQGNAFLQHIQTAGTWIAAYAVIGKSVQLLEAGVGSAIKTERQFATLQTVFRGTHEQALELGETTLKLATAEGRAGDEAADAVVRWSRLGLTQRETAEAVDVSLAAANVAEISAAEGAEHLAAIFAAYRLEVGELRGVLNEVNTVSNTLNVTNKDLFQGIARVGAVAKQAHVPLAELIGLVGAGVSRTGRSGAEIGNALKSTIVAIANPAIQKKLEGVFNFNVKTPLGELKDFSEVLSELFVKVQGMDDASRGELLQKLGGKQQASRLQAIFEGYVTGQVKAIEAQKDMNTTERESALIRGTVVSQLQSLTTEFQRLFYVMLTVGGETSVLTMLRKTIGTMTTLEGIVADHPWLLHLPGDATGAGLPGVAMRYLMGKIIPAAGGGGDPARTSDEIGIFNRKLEEAKGTAGAAELSERLAKTMARSIEETSRRDPKAADQSLREFATVTGRDAGERNLTAEELVQLREENRYRELEVKLQALSAGFADKKREAQASVAQQTAEELAIEEQKVAAIQKQIELRRGQGKDTRSLERELAEAREAVDRTKGQGKQKLLHDYVDEEGFSPLDAVEKALATRTKILMGGQDKLFEGGIGDTENDKLDRTLAKLAAEEEALKRLEAQKNAAFSNFSRDSVDFRGNPTHSASEIMEQDQMNIAIASEVATRREAIDAEREKVGLLRESARIQDEMAKGSREARAKLAGTQIGTNDTEQNIAEVKGIGRLSGNAGTDARGQAEIIVYGNRLLEIQAALGERRFTIEKSIANARLEQNREAGKALEMASREDQLRAALLAKYVKQNGAISGDRFQFLDQETRSAAQKFLPEATPSGGKVGDLTREQSLLQKNFDGLNGSIQLLLDGMKRVLDPGLLIKGGGAPGGGLPAPQVHPPNVNFYLGPDFEEMTKGLYAVASGEVRSQVAGIAAKVDAFLARQRASRAQGGGAGSINS